MLTLASSQKANQDCFSGYSLFWNIQGRISVTFFSNSLRKRTILKSANGSEAPRHFTVRTWLSKYSAAGFGKRGFQKFCWCLLMDCFALVKLLEAVDQIHCIAYALDTAQRLSSKHRHEICKIFQDFKTTNW